MVPICNIKLVDKSKKTLFQCNIFHLSLFQCCIYASLELIFICFKLSWFPLFCLESRFLSKFVFCEITLLQPLFLAKKKVSIFFLQNGRNYPTTAFIFLPMTYFFFASTTSFGCFHRFGQFFGRNSSQKKTHSMWKDIILFFSDSIDFF